MARAQTPSDGEKRGNGGETKATLIATLWAAIPRNGVEENRGASLFQSPDELASHSGV